MGEILTDFSVRFNGSVKLEARAERLTSEAGAVLLREVDERLGLTRWLGERLTDTREESRVTHSSRELVRTHLLLLVQGWKDIGDADTLREDAAPRLAVSDSKRTGPLKQEEGRPEGLASQPALSRLTAMLAQEGNREVLREALVWLTGRRLRASRPGGKWLKQVTVDVDGLPVEVHGHQEGQMGAPFSEGKRGGPLVPREDGSAFSGFDSRRLPRPQFTFTADQAAATALTWALSAPWRSDAAASVASRAPA
ncbi:transposase [Archangium violaceum]|uniref:transposase n=1 Tax=Archangium violaceum TaxID=83451 RepID=UPI000697A984|nr:transposase [Archangium violaceum]